MKRARADACRWSGRRSFWKTFGCAPFPQQDPSLVPYPFSAGSPLYQNVTVGGQTPDGRDAVNELSCLVLRTVARCHLPQPNLTVRYHSGMSDAFLRECIEVIRCGFGMPAFNNDEIIIPSFLDLGVAREDAYNYSAIGCVEWPCPASGATAAPA
jgi:formate C-acetyltransferase